MRDHSPRIVRRVNREHQRLRSAIREILASGGDRRAGEVKAVLDGRGLRYHVKTISLTLVEMVDEGEVVADGRVRRRFRIAR